MKTNISHASFPLKLAYYVNIWAISFWKSLIFCLEIQQKTVNISKYHKPDFFQATVYVYIDIYLLNNPQTKNSGLW